MNSIFDHCFLCEPIGVCPPIMGHRVDTDKLHRENIELRREVGYWKSQHQRAVAREALLKQENAELKAKLSLRERQLFAPKSEKGNGKSSQDEASSESSTEKTTRPRGQQKGSKGHVKRDHSHLSAVEEVREIPQDDRYCPDCGNVYKEFGTPDESEIIEIEIKPYIRRIKNKKYKKTCACPNQPGILTAPPAARLIPKTKHGISVWVEILLSKFQFMQPTNRLLKQWQLHSLDLPTGTITDSLCRIQPLLTPVYEAIAEYSLGEQQWHADETRWQVFEKVEGKVGYRWYMWGFVSKSTVVYVLDPSRAATVPESYFGVAAAGILIVDRYSAYKKLVKSAVKIVLAYCWAHVRRDFISLSRDWPHLEEWGLKWVADIGRLYHLNKQRLAVRNQPAEWMQRQQELEQAVELMKTEYTRELAKSTVHSAIKKVLTSLDEHWTGLTVFVDHPDVPMDNNTAERAMRPPVMGRKSFYGSGAKWSGQLFVEMHTIFQTLLKWQINTHAWLTSYLQACAENGSAAPVDISGFLPWNMSDDLKRGWAIQSSRVCDSS